MREANEDLNVVSERSEWRTPIMTKFNAEDAEAAGITHKQETLHSTS